jgi:hypothetical protein
VGDGASIDRAAHQRELGDGDRVPGEGEVAHRLPSCQAGRRQLDRRSLVRRGRPWGCPVAGAV